MSRPKKEKTSFIYAVGRRKRSVARVRLFKGKGQSLVNNRPSEDFFKSTIGTGYLKPFDLTETTGKYYVTARIVGGGKSGQLGAFLLALSRSLVKADEKFRKVLRDNGLLTRDPRERERRKPGLASGARAGKQSPKR